MDDCKHNTTHNLSSLEGGGRGRGGGGYGGDSCGSDGGYGQGRGGCGSDGRRPDNSNGTKSVTTVGGQALKVAKLPTGTWDTVSISRGDRDHLAKKQVHISQHWYPGPQYLALEPLERWMLFLNQK